MQNVFCDVGIKKLCGKHVDNLFIIIFNHIYIDVSIYTFSSVAYTCK